MRLGSKAARAPTSSPSSSRCVPRSSIGGAHGKTTTTAMVAYALRELGNDPSWIVGGVVPAARRERGRGGGLARRRRRRVGSLDLCPATGDRRRDEHRARPSRRHTRRRPSSPPSSRSGSPARPEPSADGSSSRLRSSSACRASTTAPTRRRRSRSSTLREWSATPPSRRSRRSPAWVAGSSSSANAAECALIDDYGHNPTEIAAALRTARELEPHALDRRLSAARLRADAPAPPGARTCPRHRRRRGRDGRDRRP